MEDNTQKRKRRAVATTSPSTSARMTNEVVDDTSERIISALFRQAGFDGLEGYGMLDRMVEVMDDFMENVMRLAHAHGETAGRTQPHLNDISKAFTDIGYSTAHLESTLAQARSLASSMSLKHATLPSTAITFNPPVETYLPSDEEEEDLAYVPSHLPHLPPRHSYKHTPVYVDRPTDPREIREKRVQGAKVVEGALRKLLQVAGEMGSEATTVDAASNVEEVLPPFVNCEIMAHAKRKQRQLAS